MLWLLLLQMMMMVMIIMMMNRLVGCLKMMMVEAQLSKVM